MSPKLTIGSDTAISKVGRDVELNDDDVECEDEDLLIALGGGCKGLSFAKVNCRGENRIDTKLDMQDCLDQNSKTAGSWGPPDSPDIANCFW